MATADNRKYQRLSAINNVRIESPMKNGESIVGKVENLSLGGFLFSTPVTFKKGSVLTFKIQIMNSEVDVQGEIVYSRIKDEDSFMCGVRFNHLSQNDEEQIKSFITHTTRKPHEISVPSNRP
jgi:c-di-GMP-binding flagellar brake protein YcgR